MAAAVGRPPPSDVHHEIPEWSPMSGMYAVLAWTDSIQSEAAATRR